MIESKDVTTIARIGADLAISNLINDLYTEELANSFPSTFDDLIEFIKGSAENTRARIGG